MKHSSTQAFFAYWEQQRGTARAPDRSDIEPGPVRELLGDSFVLSCDKSAGFPFRVAGTRLCALFGKDLKDHSMSPLIAAAHHSELADIIDIVSGEMLVAVAGLTASGANGVAAPLELLLLPFNTRAHTPVSLTGLLVPLVPCTAPVGPLHLTSFRYLAHPPQKFRPRLIRKWQAARGLMVYEGLR